MTEPKDKRLRVGGLDYIIDDGVGQDLATIARNILQALTDKTVVLVPVFDDQRNRMTLYLNGAQVDALVIDPGNDPRPGEFGP